ncbi:hypothetical protein GCM10007916_21070 [Psychromonas marina]|uniref:DUF2835 family protein n=1 Tax=Psychromonas marina TaxID=88364 RepID=A0ABQ6E0T3_9GAMM|nr:DUF2835 domain-containing protein [Psychromonas marina]GLS91039.1 hypothetical protein GCM10007916_21070 [Psychromonas marina]
MKHYYFRLNITYQAFEQLYRTPNTVVKVREENGAMLQMPAMRLVPFFSQLGVRGRFELTLDDNNKFQKLQQLSA